MPKVAVIGGSGVYDPQLLDNVQDKEIETIYGKAKVAIGTYKGIEVAFMARHGSGHSVPPGKINYRANIQALKDIGVEHVISTSAVGSLQQDVPPGTFVLLNNFLDFTKAREATFFDGGARGVAHVDVTNPYCPTLGPSIFKQAKEMGINVLETGTYVCCEGPRYETGAEVKLYSSFGGTVVGMTNVPECVLAREAELCYQTICIVTNYAAGISPTKLTHKEVVELMAENIEALKKLVFTVIENIDKGERTCSCATALEGASG